MITSPRPYHRLARLVVVIALMAPALRAAEVVALRALELVPTLASLGAYADVDGPLDGLRADLTYRRVGDPAWSLGLEPVACPEQQQFRGSVLLLQPGTEYEVRVRVHRADTVVATATAKARTWSEPVPVAREVVLAPGVSNEPLVITAQGKPDGWIRYRAAPGGSTIDAGARAPHAVVLDHAAYVIVDGITVRGGASDAVYVLDSHDVRVRGCDIAGWGDPGKWGFYTDKKRRQWCYLEASGRIIDHQAGIRVHGAGSIRVVIENNLIHDPRGTANCWAFLHPHGPEGVVLSETGGNIVVRDNDLIAGDGHRWNDAIASEYNNQVIGGPHRDTDISGNLLMDSNDDGTELDGGQMNVRYWDNWIEGGYCGVSCAPNLRGPSYVFSNLMVTSDERGATGAGFKMGGAPGTSFLFNNTVFVAGGYGLSSGHYGKVASPIVARNNVYAGPAPGLGKVRYDGAVTGDLDHDLIPADGLLGTAAARPGREGAAVYGRPDFLAPQERDFRLQASSVGRGAGVKVANLVGAGADLGAPARASWPLRPGAPVARPGFAAVRVREGESAEQSFTIADVAPGESLSATTGAPWITSRMMPGAEAGQRLLVCRIDATALNSGTHRTFVSVRNGAGIRRSIPLQVDVVAARPFARVVQAESLPPTPEFAARRAAEARDGGLVEAVAARLGPPLTWDLDLPAGKYCFFARVRARGPVAKVATQDSITLQIDDGPVMTWELYGLSDGAWTWSRATPVENVAGVFTLAAGPHRVRVGAREAGAQVDEIEITNQPYPTCFSNCPSHF